MDASDFNRLITAHHYSPAELEQVNDLCRNLPVFSLAHMLKVRMHEALEKDKEEALRVAAVYAGDRRKLFEFVSEVTKMEVPEEEPPEEEPGGIRFSDEPHREADVIIVQHAPYAGPQTDSELLELDEEEAFVLDQETDEALSPETLMEALAKDDVELEDTASEAGETPVLDAVKPEVPTANSLILNFLNDVPGPIRADKKSGSREDVSLASIREHDGFITDTLAKIYVKQRLYAKAIYAYEKLSLKYPEKSAYFAAQIEKIRNINHS
ncbi:MAG: hypothetical protein V2B15_06400 [Bacteroidota bacterium]